METLPRDPLPLPGTPLDPPEQEEEATGIAQALATFSLSALLGAGALIFCAPATHTCGASRSAQLRRADVKKELEAADGSPSSPESPGSTPSR